MAVTVLSCMMVSLSTCNHREGADQWEQERSGKVAWGGGS